MRLNGTDMHHKAGDKKTIRANKDVFRCSFYFHKYICIKVIDNSQLNVSLKTMFYIYLISANYQV